MRYSHLRNRLAAIAAGMAVAAMIQTLLACSKRIDDRKNPFVVSDPSAQSAIAQLSACVEASLSVDGRARGRQAPELRGQVVIDNHCARSISVLTSPVEIRIKHTREQTFPSEVTETPYVLAYAFPTALGLTPKSFVGDGGVTVRALPTYASLKGGETGKFELRGTEELRRELGSGTHRLIMIIPVAFAYDRDGSGERVFDFRRSVKAQNVRATGISGPIYLPLSASRITAKSTEFRIENLD